MTDELASYIANAVRELFGVDKRVLLTRTDEKFGDFSSNIAMQISKDLQKSPLDIANELVKQLRSSSDINECSVAGPGFINIKVSDEFLGKGLVLKPTEPNDQTFLLEYSCPNAFKELHTGHLYQTLIGDAMARVYEKSGYKVIRTSFGGDVGLHAAKCMWGVLQSLGGEHPEKLELQTSKSAWVADAYVNGSSKYESDEKAKNEIDSLNNRIYEVVNSGDTTSDFAIIFYTVRQWSYDYFEQFYESIGVHPFDKYYPESQTLKPGLELVESHKGSVFTESEGAIVLDKEKSGLHTRVFITSGGLPTYETKDLGVIQLETNDYPYDNRIVLTGNDQSEYMRVVFSALKLIDPELAGKQKHVANGTVRFGDGTKMSSRLGNVSRAVDVIDTVEASVETKTPELTNQISLGAIKYSLLKGRVGGDIAFDIKQSISKEGNSGPYLQYALVRARSILRKVENSPQNSPVEFDADERRLAVKLSEYPEVLLQSLGDYSPHHICTYLYELAQSFNRFYENARVIDHERSATRIWLLEFYENTLSDGLDLLGVPKPEEM